MEVVQSPPRLHNATNTGIMNGGGGSHGNDEEKKKESTTMKAAAELIQSLDNAYSEMKHSAVDAARDAENARRNARAASEIARRYLHRTYPKVQTQFGASPGTPTQRSSSKQQTSSSLSVEEESHKVNTTINTNNNENDPLRQINGIASELQTPRNNPHQYDHNTGSSNNRYRQNSNIYSPPMSSDRLAQNHADEILALTMELERTKQALKSEQRQHEESKSSLGAIKAKHQSLETQNQKLLEELETTKRDSETLTSQLEQELQKAKYSVQAAEDDAQLALDIAKDADEKNLQLEDDLKKAMDEIRMLKRGMIDNSGKGQFETPKRAVRFADDDNTATATATPTIPPHQEQQTLTPVSSSTPRSGGVGPSREMIATGRQLLRRRMGTSPEDEVITLELTPSKSAERRRRLKDRLTQQQPSLADNLPTPRQSSSSPQRSDIVTNSKLLEECRSSVKLLEQSGQRLDLSGHWWRDNQFHHQHQQQQAHDIHLEVMTRQYCQSVEFSIERQKKEINELESLCGYLEKKIVTGK